MDVDKSVLHFKNTSEQEEKSYPLSLKSNVNEILRPLFLTQVNYFFSISSIGHIQSICPIDGFNNVRWVVIFRLMLLMEVKK